MEIYFHIHEVFTKNDFFFFSENHKGNGNGNGNSAQTQQLTKSRISPNISEGKSYHMNWTLTNLDSGHNRKGKVNKGEVKIETDLPFVDKVCRGEMLPKEVLRDFGRAEFALHLRDLQGVVARGLPRSITHLLCRLGHQNKKYSS